MSSKLGLHLGKIQERTAGLLDLPVGFRCFPLWFLLAFVKIGHLTGNRRATNLLILGLKWGDEAEVSPTARSALYIVTVLLRALRRHLEAHQLAANMPDKHVLAERP